MKINNTKPKDLRRTLFLIILAVLLVAGGYAAYAHHYLLWPFQPKSSINTEAPTAPQKSAGNQIKSQNATTDQSTTNKTGTGSDPSPAPTPSTTGGKATAGMQIISANVNNGTLSVRALLQYVTSQGTCTLTMTNNAGQTYTATASIQPGPSTSTCGFNVPTSKLSSGKWSIAVTYDGTTVTGAASKEVTL